MAASLTVESRVGDGLRMKDSCYRFSWEQTEFPQTVLLISSDKINGPRLQSSSSVDVKGNKN